jgi:uncharacterized protein (TIGR02757 family)
LRYTVLPVKTLKAGLDRWYEKVNRPEFIAADPVRFPHRYSRREDVEIAAFLAAAIAWGRRELILRSCERMFGLLGPSPYGFVMAGDFSGLTNRCVHRTFFGADLAYYCRGFRACYQKHGGLEALFASRPGVWDGIALFREEMAAANGGAYSKHVANPAAGSACKRVHLSLRWLVRREGPVDLGLWKRLSPSALCVPLDLHSGRAARALGLLDRKSNDRKAVAALTEQLRAFCPEDPAKYDLALFGMSMARRTGFCP